MEECCYRSLKKGKITKKFVQISMTKMSTISNFNDENLQNINENRKKKS